MRIVVLTLLLLTLTGCGARAAGPQGLYLRTQLSGGSLSIAAYRFAGGTVVRNPIAGADEVESERAQRPQDVGTYRLDGGSLVVSFAGKPVSGKFEPGDAGCFGWDAGLYCPVGAFARGARIDGVYAGGASAGGGAAMSAMTLTLRADGTYLLSSTASLATGTSAGTVGSSGGESGSYRFDENALTLTPAAGPARRYSSFPYDDGSAGPAPRRIYFGGGMLKRQN